MHSWLHILGVVLCCVVSVVEARVGGDALIAGHSVQKDKRISPTLEPESDKKFFGKDYPWDKRPSVDVLHFKHPYPIVQDSGDYDSDYVKDENNDNGEWFAQTEYDRLRHKLAEEKKHVAGALAARDRAEKELQDALKRDKLHKEDVAAKKKKQIKKGKVEASKGEAKHEHHHAKKTPLKPGGMSSAGDVKVATQDTEKAMQTLEDCKKELAEARERLKKLMDELEEYKKKKRHTEDNLGVAEARRKEAKETQIAVEKAVHNEYEDYVKAKNAYLQQQAKVAQMEKDIEAAAAKVKAIRDAEDKDGGVYPTPNQHSSTIALTPMIGLACMISTAMLVLAL